MRIVKLAGLLIEGVDKEDHVLQFEVAHRRYQMAQVGRDARYGALRGLD